MRTPSSCQLDAKTTGPITLDTSPDWRMSRICCRTSGRAWSASSGGSDGESGRHLSSQAGAPVTHRHEHNRPPPTLRTQPGPGWVALHPGRQPTAFPAARQVHEVQNSPALVSRAPTPRRTTEDFPTLIGRVVTRRFTISSTRCWDGVASRPTTRRRPSAMWMISSSALVASMTSMPPSPGAPTGLTTRSTRSRSSGPNEFDSACPLRRQHVLCGLGTRQATSPISRVGSSSDPAGSTESGRHGTGAVGASAGKATRTTRSARGRRTKSSLLGPKGSTTA